MCIVYMYIRKSDCLGCAVLLCLVCLFDLACLFLSSFSSPMYMYCILPLTAPHPRTRERSLPVPSGSTATGGNGLMQSSSMTDSTQPTVPSPPHARMRTLLRSWNIFRLTRGEERGGEGRRGEGEGEGGEEGDSYKRGRKPEKNRIILKHNKEHRY